MACPGTGTIYVAVGHFRFVLMVVCWCFQIVDPNPYAIRVVYAGRTRWHEGSSLTDHGTSIVRIRTKKKFLTDISALWYLLPPWWCVTPCGITFARTSAYRRCGPISYIAVVVLVPLHTCRLSCVVFIQTEGSNFHFSSLVEYCTVLVLNQRRLGSQLHSRTPR